MAILKISVFLVLTLHLCHGKPMDLPTKEYLHKYGYLESMDHTDEELDAAVKDFQYFVGMNMTGEMDAPTMEFLKRPRCGMPDYPPAAIRNRRPSGRARWDQSQITYGIVNSSTFSRQDLRTVFSNAINLWTKAVNLNVRESNGNRADISVHFNSQDGPGQTLGYAYFPTLGSIYFDRDENWSLSSQRGRINFNWVATHELGHALGLNHINDPQSIMNPYYQDVELKLSRNDQRQINELYGGRGGNVDNTNLCSDPKIDDVLYYPLTRQYFLFKGDRYWTFTGSGMRTGPFQANALFKNFPGSIDAAFSTGKFTFFLKGDSYYRYYRNGRTGAVKRPISVGIGNTIPANMDASFYHPNGTIYMFKGAEFFTITTNRAGGMRMNLRNARISQYFNGVPDNIEAATLFQRGSQAFFSKSGQFYIYDFATRSVAGAAHSITRELFNCPSR